MSEVDDTTITLEFGEGENRQELQVKIGELSQVVGRLMTINQATISHSRTLKTGEYKSESPFFSIQVNLGEAWQAIPKSALADPKYGPAIWKQVMDATNKKLGNSARYVYRNILASCLARAKDLGLTEAANLEKEMERFGSTPSYDPFGVLPPSKE